MTSAASPRTFRLAEVIGALSYALDITEGQPEGHAARSCLIGMHIARQIGLCDAERSALFYALLLKDAGCSSNAAKMTYLFGADDRKLKHDAKLIDWQRAGENLRFLRLQAAPEGGRIERLLRIAAMLLQGPRGAKQLVETRCERGADIALRLGFPAATAEAIRHLDEHYNGKGQPHGLRGEAISLLGRIAGLAQTVEVFFSHHGPDAARAMAQARSGHWFDPRLAETIVMAGDNSPLWQELRHPNPFALVGEREPPETPRHADEALLDQVAEAFSQVVDAKSPWTFKHSSGVATIATGMGEILGFEPLRLRRLRRAALLHDIGKLGVSNMILDKPGKLTDDEMAVIRLHPEYSERILLRISAFRDDALIAGGHHERLDGRGYYRQLPSAQLPLEVRLVMVADIFEALTAARPYREGMPVGKVLSILRDDAGKGICATSFEALESWLRQRDYTDRIEHQLQRLECLASDMV